MRCCSRPALAALLAAVLACAAPLRADDAWPALSPAEREMLAPFAAEWSSLDGPTRARLRVLSDRWTTLPEARRAREMQRFREWQRLPPEQRAELRDRQRAFQQLDESERARVRGEFERWQQLTPRERRALRSALGQRAAPWRVALRGMDAPTRRRVRAAVAELPPASRQQLRGHVQGLDAAGVDRVLRGLVDQPAGARAAYVAQLPAAP